MVLIEVYPNGREIERDDGHPRKITYYEVLDPDVIEWLRWGDEEAKIERRRRRKAYHTKAARIARHTEACYGRPRQRNAGKSRFTWRNRTENFGRHTDLNIPNSRDSSINIIFNSREEDRKSIKDTIVLENREFHSTNRVKHDFDHKTLVKWVKIGKLPLPVRLGNRAYYDRGVIESRLLSTAHE